MKKFLMVAITLIASVSVFAQDKTHYRKENMFYTEFKSGIGEVVPVKFLFAVDAMNKILASEIYKNWEVKTFSNPENQKFVEKFKSLEHIDIFLMSECSMASFYAKMGLKNGDSFTPIATAEGFIYVNDKNEICFSFPFKGQNGYGNMIIAKEYYTLAWKDGETKRKDFISSN